MAERSVLRWIAPLALVAVIAAGFVIVTSTGGEGEDGGTTTASTQAGGNGGGDEGGSTKRAEKKFYRVREGDLLSTISETTEVPTETLIELNPELDPQALQTGQLVRLRR